MDNVWWVVAFLAVAVATSWIERARTEKRLRALEAKYERLARHAGWDSTLDSSLPSAEVESLARTPGRKIEAIKLYREQSGAGLMQAKDAVERIEAAAGGR